jgi:hypothetical protein
MNKPDEANLKQENDMYRNELNFPVAKEANANRTNVFIAAEERDRQEFLRACNFREREAKRKRDDAAHNARIDARKAV